MPKSEAHTPVDVNQVGIDRSRINHHQQVQLPLRTEHAIPSQGPEEHAEPERKRDKIRKALHLGHDSAHESPIAHDKGSKESALLAVADNDPPKNGIKETVRKVTDELDKETIKGLVKNPIHTIHEKATAGGGHEFAANIASKEIPHEQDKELVKAHDAVQDASPDPERMLAKENLERLLKERQTRYVRWTLDRHVTKVRVLPRDLMSRKPMVEFQHKDSTGRMVTDWNTYTRHLLVYYVQQYGGQYVGAGTGVPPPSKQNIVPNLERLLVTSAPFQQIAMTVRRVYQWQSRSETAKYLAIYIVLWWFNIIICGALSAVVYFIIERRVRGFKIEDLRKDVERTENAQATALSLTEFIEKRGDERWADDVIQTAGPWLMLQMADMSNAFDALRNFYEWRVPHRTAVTLSIMVMSIIGLLLIPSRLLAKGAGLAFGFAFFCVWPISTNYPDYRLLTSVPKRIFWNIPTNAEWAIKYIQAEGSREISRAAQDMPNTPGDSSSASQIYVIYNAQYKGKDGRLTISGSSVCFEYVRDPSLLAFNLRYDQINKVEKENEYGPSMKNVTGKHLRLVTRAGEEWLLENVDERDMSFSQIIGLSDCTWQVLW